MCSLSRFMVQAIVVWCLLLCLAGGTHAEDAGFLNAKTIFQTNTGYDTRLAIAADGVIVHRHGGRFAPELQSWQEKGFDIGRMFFADSDAANAYWTGKCDGTPYPQDVETQSGGGGGEVRRGSALYVADRRLDSLSPGDGGPILERRR